MEATQSRLGQDIDLRSCPDWPVIQDSTTWQHVCINLRSCFTSVVGGIEHEVSRIQFDNTGNSFWIDDFTISQAQVSSKCIQLLQLYEIKVVTFTIVLSVCERGGGNYV